MIEALWDGLDAELAAMGEPVGAWWVGLSGGRDSVVLLDLIHRWACQRSLPAIRAIHINHGLNPDADAWAALCQRHCDQRGIDLTIRKVAIADISESGLEAAARSARYAEFTKVLQAGDTLMLAHHADDQAETILYRLLRGAGPRGLSGMPRTRILGRGRLHRPLLWARRELIDLWADVRGLEYVDDPSNRDTNLDRNYLRHSVMPLLAVRWPAASSSIVRAGQLQARAVQELARQPLATGQTLFGEPALVLAANEECEALADRLHRWLTLDGVLVPSRARLLDFAQQILTAAPDRCPELNLGDITLRRWREQVVRCQEATQYWGDGDNNSRPASGQSQILPGEIKAGDDLAGPWGVIIWQPAEEGGGLPVGHPCTVRTRVEGERLGPLNGANRPFKQLCQERGVPPWWRECLPLLVMPETGKPLFAPALGNLSGFEDAPLTAENPRVKPVWVAPLGDSSIEQDGAC